MNYLQLVSPSIHLFNPRHPSLSRYSLANSSTFLSFLVLSGNFCSKGPQIASNMSSALGFVSNFNLAGLSRTICSCLGKTCILLRFDPHIVFTDVFKRKKYDLIKPVLLSVWIPHCVPSCEVEACQDQLEHRGEGGGQILDFYSITEF